MLDKFSYVKNTFLFKTSTVIFRTNRVITLMNPVKFRTTTVKFLSKLFFLFYNYISLNLYNIFNRPGVAGAVLHTPPSLVDSLIH